MEMSLLAFDSTMEEARVRRKEGVGSGRKTFVEKHRCDVPELIEFEKEI